MRLLVITGCLGLIGAYVTRNFLLKGYRVYGIDKCTYAANTHFLDEFQDYDTFTFIQDDIATLNYLPDCDYVINIAAESHVGNSIINSADFLTTNVMGVRNLLDLIRSKPRNVSDPPVFLHFSTDEVYGDITDGEHIETDILKPSNPYSASKAAADMLIMAWQRTYDLKCVILRPTNNYGIGQYPEKLIPLTVKLLMRDKQIKLHDKGEPIRNWLHADDTAHAVATLVDNGIDIGIYNVAGGFEQKNIDTVSQVLEAYFGEKRDWSEYLDLSYVREGQDVRYALNDDKLRSLGWKPLRRFEREIPHIVEYYKHNFKW